ncbi:PD-(D/E)XK nuclease family protein [Acidithiobacillus albertensis]|nr:MULTISPECIES: PD-(D/E)XK nuclease family protein [Acidithiobacillus]MDD5278676.1 PD-(D/E)XK nuclease family protein [Acidithiobacillus sp.]
METCARQYWYKSLRIKPKEKDRKMLLGNIRHLGFEHILRTDHPAICDDRRLTNDETDAINAELAKFYDWWMNCGLTPAYLNGRPAIEMRMEALHPDDPSIILVTRLDLLAVDDENRHCLVDWKSGKTQATQCFVDHADQLTFMQVIVDGHLQQAGLGQVDSLAIVETKPPSARLDARVTMIPSPKRGATQVQDLLDKTRVIAERIRNQEFFATSRYGFNSPCNMCEYQCLCENSKNTQGFNIPSGVIIPVGLFEEAS